MDSKALKKMGSLELDEESLVQMVHDFIESGSSPVPIFPASSTRHSMTHQAKFFTLQDIMGTATEGESKVLECVLKHMRNKKESQKTTSLKKWLVMRLKVDGFNASFCHNPLGYPAGAYEYIDIVLSNGSGEMLTRLIVDIDFRSQFELARPTPAYKELVETLPSIFVGSEEKLNKIISLICSAAKRSLKERGLHVPPWRTSAYMQSKWLSGCRNDITTANGTGGTTTDANSYDSRGMDINRDAKTGAERNLSVWAPPMVKPKTKSLGGSDGTMGSASALSSQFSNRGINCC